MCSRTSRPAPWRCRSPAAPPAAPVATPAPAPAPAVVAGTVTPTGADELTLTIADLRRRRACDLDERIADLRCVLPDVQDDEPVPLTTWWALPSTCVEDRWWSLRAAEPAIDARRLGVRAACRAARRVLPLEPELRAVCLGAIDAAEAWAEEPTDERATAAACAAYAAFAAADAAAACAAYAAFAAAYAAYVDAAAYAAADAAYAAYAAYVDAAADAAADAARQTGAHRPGIEVHARGHEGRKRIRLRHRLL